jgi:UDP-N-acetylglucosamine acyltransferase
MLAAGSDKPEIITVNVVGMRRRGISENAISLVRMAHKWIYREHLKLEEIRDRFMEKTEGVLPIELMTLLNFCEQSSKGKNGRARETYRGKAVSSDEQRAA